MSFLDKLLGRPRILRAREKKELSVMTGVPALGLDALSSTAYGPEAALFILLPLGVLGLHYFLFITAAIVATLFILYLSYQQTIAAYPNGGGAYIVASDNFGKRVGLWAAIALLLDYFLNVAVGISAGIAAVVSAIPQLQPYTLSLCLLVLFILTIVNLRGVRESGVIFMMPTIIFIGCLAIVFITGLIQGGTPSTPPPVVASTDTIGMWLLLGAFANGLTAMTGVEAVSNAVPVFRQPSVRNARLTLTVIVALLGLFLLAVGYLCPVYQIIAMDESQPGYQTILSQLVAGVMGKGAFYHLAIASIFIVLVYSTQTSFVDFPRVCRLLAEDNYLPHFFAERGRRLVFSHGIVVLALFSAVLLIVFQGSTQNLIPLFAVGAFSAFLFSQAGMVKYWLRNKGPYFLLKLGVNAVGAFTTAIALMIIISVKFTEGAWIIVITAPVLALLFLKINKHYKKITRVVDQPLELQVSQLKLPAVIIPIHGWDRVSEKAVRFGMLISDDVTAVFISTGDEEEIYQLKKLWKENVTKPCKLKHRVKPHLKIIYSPYRRIYKPIIDFVNKEKKRKPDRLIAVIIPELVEPHWYERLLHNIHAAGLRALLFLERDQRTVVITTPWYLR